jgi:hypothetical protein
MNDRQLLTRDLLVLFGLTGWALTLPYFGSEFMVSMALTCLMYVALSSSWGTGGAQGYFEDAIAAGADAFITGEISEPQAHYARECGVAYFACGHHASERYGAPAVAGHVAAGCGIEHRFIDIDNPA